MNIWKVFYYYLREKRLLVLVDNFIWFSSSCSNFIDYSIGINWGVCSVWKKFNILINRYEKMMKGLNCWVNLLIKVVLGVYLLGEV